MIREEDKKKVMDIAIVDDNRLWQKRILDSILSCFEDELPTIRIFSSGEQLIRANIPFTAVFLDFEMPGINGFDTALSYGGLFPDAYLILLTEHGEFSRKGYLVNAFRYIEKAYMDEEIPEALSAIGLLEDPGGEITVRVYHEGPVTIREKHIVCVETIPHGSLIHTKDRDYRAAIPIGELERMLNTVDFYRSHNAWIINWKYVQNCDSVDIDTDYGFRPMVSRKRLPEARQLFFEYKILRARG